MHITPGILHQIKQNHMAVAEDAADYLSGRVGKDAAYENKQARKAPLYYVSRDATKEILEHMETPNSQQSFLPTAQGWIAFEGGTGLRQPFTPFLVSNALGNSSLPKAEIHGLFWFQDESGRLVVNPIFQAEELRKVDPRIAPKKYFKDWFPFIAQRTLFSLLGQTKDMVQANNLLKHTMELMRNGNVTEKSIPQKGQGNVWYSLMEGGEQEATETPEVALPAMNPTEVIIPGDSPTSIPQINSSGPVIRF